METKQLKVSRKTHSEIMKLKAELFHKNVEQTIKYLLYELNNQKEFPTGQVNQS